MKIYGAVLAIDRLGQRDTRWLFPLTVSGGYQREEGDRHISGACSYPTAASAFSIADCNRVYGVGDLFNRHVCGFIHSGKKREANNSRHIPIHAIGAESEPDTDLLL